MDIRLAAAAAALALAAAPALAQNSSTITPSDVPVSNGGLDPNIGQPAANADPRMSREAADPANRTHGADGPVTPRGARRSGASGGASTSATSRDMTGVLAGSSSASSSSDFGPPPSSYPLCRTRAQDRCRVR